MINNKQKITSGFTLMELMIVVAIIGILAMIAVPSYQQYTKKARFTEILNAATPFRIAIETCFQLTGDISSCMPGKNGVPKTTLPEKSLVKSLQIKKDGSIVLTPKNEHQLSQDDQLILKPSIQQGFLSWVPAGKAVERGLL